MAAPKRYNIPLYTQIASSLRAEIEAGQWPAGSKLPAIDDLALRFGVARQTMRQALIGLEDEGFILRKHGSGTFVQVGALEQRWLSLPTDWASLVSITQGLEARIMLVSVSDRMPRPGGSDGKPAAAYKFMKRLHFRDDRPFSIADIFLSSEIYLKNPKAFREQVVTPLLDQMPDVEIGQVLQNIRVDVADAETAKLLDIPIAGAVVRVNRVMVDKSGTSIYVADIVYRGDVVQLKMDLSPGNGAR